MEYGLLLGVVALVLSLLKLLKLMFLAAVTVGELHRAVVVSVQDRIAELLALLEPTASPLLLPWFCCCCCRTLMLPGFLLVLRSSAKRVASQFGVILLLLLLLLLLLRWLRWQRRRNWSGWSKTIEEATVAQEEGRSYSV